MVARTRVQSMQRQVRVLLDRAMSPEAMSQRLAAAARSALADAQAHNASILGRVPEHETIVDGRRGVSEDSVRPDGVIVHEFADALRESVLEDIGAMLVKHSPVKTGKFARSFRIYIDGVEHVPGTRTPPDATEAIFLNIQPYARKIERGQSDQAPNGVFEGVATIAAQRYGNIASIKFTFRSLEGGDAVKARRPRARGDRNRGTDTRQPAIYLRFR